MPLPEKILLFIFLMGFSAVSTATVIQAPFGNLIPSYTLIPNGDFENNIGWSGYGAYSTEQAYSGARSWKMTAPYSISGPGFAASSSSVGGLTIGETYVLSGFINTFGLSNSPNPQVYIDISDAANDPNAGLGELLFGLDLNAWQFVYQEFVAASSSVTVRTVIDLGLTGGAYAYFDDVAITRKTDFMIADVPAPATLALSVLGLAGLGFRRRKNSK